MNRPKLKGPWTNVNGRLTYKLTNNWPFLMSVVIRVFWVLSSALNLKILLVTKKVKISTAASAATEIARVITPTVKVVISFYTRDWRLRQIIEPTTIYNQLLLSNCGAWRHTRCRFPRLEILYNQWMVLREWSDRCSELRNYTRSLNSKLIIV